MSSRNTTSLIVLLSFILATIVSPTIVCAQVILDLPQPGVMVNPSPAIDPVMIKGLTIHANDPFKFDFIIDTGHDKIKGEALKREGEKLVRYFLACLSIPEQDLWVNLSPYEKNRVIPTALGQTAMGNDLLAQDYILKQLTASLIYPEHDLGKSFWRSVYSRIQKEYGNRSIPINTFNKVWVMADRAEVFEKNNTVFVLDRHLKVMLEEDYFAAKKNQMFAQVERPNHALQTAQQITRDIILPAIEKEVNEGKNFAPLRQAFNALILASWYKDALKNTLMNQLYADQSKTLGNNANDPTIKNKIYGQYLKAYKKGVFDYIKQEPDQVTHQMVARKYFAGGILAAGRAAHPAVNHNPNQAMLSKAEVASGQWMDMSVGFDPIQSSAAMTSASEILLGTTPQLEITPQQLAVEIKKEQAVPGTGKIPLIATISDQHGTIDKFDALLLDMLRSVDAGSAILASLKLDPNRTFAEHGINLARFKGQLFIHNLGDFMDRGPFGEKIYRRSKELIDAGLSDFVIGNHDQWMFMNLIGMHLPFYDGFEFYGYKDSFDSKYGGDVRFVLKTKHAKESDTRKPEWWAKRLAEFRQFHERQQEQKWSFIDHQVNGPNGLFARMINGMDEDAKKEWYRTDAGKVWNKLRGFDPNVGEVATGVKAVGLVSIVWWQDLLEEFEKIYRILYMNGEVPQNTSSQEAWKFAIGLIKDKVIPDLKKTLEEHINPKVGEPQWWWRIFEAINSQNYTSPEWWAQDWAYHKGWGPTVFKEINDTYHGGEQVVTVANYLDENSGLKGVAVLKEIAQFFKDHYTLHIKDIMQVDHMHAFLPIDKETGEFYFNYKSTQYQGKGANRARPYWEGLHRIAEDIRNAPNGEGLIKAIYEAKTIVNGWYADNTTQAKVSHVAEALKEIGIKKIAQANGIYLLQTGHLPMHDFMKLPEDWRKAIDGHMTLNETKQLGFLFTDGGMGEKFGGGGKYVVMGRNGVYMRGFPSKKSSEIIDHPSTIIYKKSAAGEEQEKLVFQNNRPIVRETFLKSVSDQIQSASGDQAMPSRDKSLYGGIDFNRAAIKWHMKKDGSGVHVRLDASRVNEMRKKGIIGVIPRVYKITSIGNIGVIFAHSLN